MDKRTAADNNQVPLGTLLNSDHCYVFFEVHKKDATAHWVAYSECSDQARPILLGRHTRVRISACTHLELQDITQSETLHTLSIPAPSQICPSHAPNSHVRGSAKRRYNEVSNK